MRAILYWYVRVLEYIAIPALAVFAVLGVGVWSGILVIPLEYVAQLNAWGDQYMNWIGAGMVFWAVLGMTAFWNSDYSVKVGQRPLSKEYQHASVLGMLPPTLLSLTVSALSFEAAAGTVGKSWVLIGLMSVLGGLVLGLVVSLVVRALIRSSWQKENIDALKEKAAEALRTQGAFMPNEVETAFKGRSYDEVYELNRQCETIGSLTEKQTNAYNTLMETMKGYGVNVSTGAAFSNKSAAELLAEQEGKTDDR